MSYPLHIKTHLQSQVEQFPCLLAPIFAFLVLFFHATFSVADDQWRVDLEQTRAELRPLEFSVDRTYPEATSRYFTRYGLDVPSVRHHFGTFEHREFRLAAHVFVPPSPRGTVIAVHGYYDHAGTWQHAIRALIAAGYTVAIYDQPGHGLSSGARAAIGDFCQYDGVLRCFRRTCGAHLDGPFHLVAHSLGAAVAVDYLMREPDPAFRRTVLLAPLVRSAAWSISGVGLALADPFVRDVPRIFRKNSSDKAFLDFMRRDPLQPRRVPMAWVRALRRWNRRIEERPSSSNALTIIQGTSDSTVDWRHNRTFLSAKFPRAQVVLIPNAGHQLLNESSVLRNTVLDNVLQALAADAPPERP